MATKIQIRRGTAARWESTNPVLADGQQGWDKTNKKMKIGDGVTAWNDLEYSGGGGGHVVVNGEGTAMPQQDNLQFVGATVTDDAVNGATKVEIHTHSNKSILDQISAAFTTALKSAYDGAVSWISTNGSNLLNHLSNTSNPHSVTKEQLNLGSVDNTSDADKPISSATQTALNGKANQSTEEVYDPSTGGNAIADVHLAANAANAGTADYATNAGSATNDSDGNQINMTYQKLPSQYSEKTVADTDNISIADSGLTSYRTSFTNIWTWIKSKLGIDTLTGSTTKFLNQVGNWVDLYTELDKKQTVFTGICQQQYLTENDVEIDTTNLLFKINTVKGGQTISANNPICFYTDGSGVATKYTKTTAQSVLFTNTTGVWYFYFDNTGTLIATQTPWTNFDNIAALFRMYWNATLTGADRCVIQSVEYHKNDISWADHAWKHNEGTKWISGFDITATKTTGTPATDGTNTCIALSTGKNVDDNLFYTVSNVASPVNKFEQDLGSAATITAGGRFLCTYNDAGGLLNKIAATRFPFLFNASNTPQYVTSTGVRTDVSANYFFVYYIYALQDPRVGEAIKIRSAEAQFATLADASAHSWETLQGIYPTLRDNEIRVLYKLVYEYKTNFDVAIKKAALRDVTDLRRQKISSLIAAGGSVLAASVSVTPPTGIVSTNAQGAINELALQAFPSNATITGQFAGSTTIPANIPQIYSDAQLTNTVTVSLGAPVANAINRYTLKFETGATKPTITWPTSGVKWVYGIEPTVNNLGVNKKYVVQFIYNSATDIEARYDER